MFAWLPYLAFLSGVAGILAGAMHLRGHAPARRWMHLATTFAAGISVLTFVVLVALFVLVRTEFLTVFSYTSTSIPLRYRIAGAWAGRDGSMVLWAMYAALVSAAVMWWHRRQPTKDERGRVWTELGLAIISTAFLGAVAWQDTFAATDAFLLQNRPQGNGLNPTLLSPFILIHPPVMFLAYALTAVPLAAVVSDQITGRQEWSTTGMLWSRVDWILYTFAMGLGGIWAYYTLGFGGYWAWDPVEVANLLPWLALTLFLHAQLHHRRHGRYRHLGPFLAVLPFFFTIFSTISTRSGLWVSVHAFTDPSDTFDPDPASRFLSILAREPGLEFHVGIMLATLFVFLGLWARRLAADTGRLEAPMQFVAAVMGALAVVAALAPATLLGMAFEAADALLGGRMGFGLLALVALAILVPAAPMLAAEETPTKWRIDMERLVLLSIVVLGVGLLVVFLWHIAAVNGWSTDAYLGRFPILSTPVFFGLILFQGHGVLRKKVWWLMGASAAAAAVAGAMAGWTGYLLALSVVLVAISAWRVLRAGLPRMERPMLIARGALWVAALLDVLFWLNPPTIRLGITWTPQWPVQLIMGTAAFVALHLATELLVGRVRRSKEAHLLVGALAGFYIAAPIALASWLVHRRHAPAGISSPRVRFQQVGLHATHFAIALILLGYVLSTYMGGSDETTLQQGEWTDVAGTRIMLDGIDTIVVDGRIEAFEPRIVVEGDGTTATTRATFYYEPQGGSHYPLPATTRLWDRDVYVAVDGVCIGRGCDEARDFLRAYEPSPQLPQGIQAADVQVQVFHLPGIAFVWTGLFLLLYAMGLRMAHGE